MPAGQEALGGGRGQASPGFPRVHQSPSEPRWKQHFPLPCPHLLHAVNLSCKRVQVLAAGHSSLPGLLSGRLWLLGKQEGGETLALSGPVNLSKIRFITSRHSSVKATQLRLQIKEFI